MHDYHNLRGHTVLVVEGDTLIATDIITFLQAAGAKVVGPCRDEMAALRVVEHERLTAAVLDVNVGGDDPLFRVANALRNHGIPFVFFTGYPVDAMPEEFRNVIRVEKPGSFDAVLDVIATFAPILD